MCLSQYAHLFTKDYMMGPNTLRLLNEALSRHPLPRGGRTLDLGCGTGLSSLYLSRETGASVVAADLWIKPTANQTRLVQWGVDQSVFPIHADANALPFAEECFDAVVSIDAYHYFACNPTYFREKLFPLVKKGGSVLIVVPGLRKEFGETVPQEILDWAGDDHTLFHSLTWWKEAVGAPDDAEYIDLWESEAGDAAWQDWFASGHKYALSDLEAFGKGIGQHLTFVGIYARKKC